MKKICNFFNLAFLKLVTIIKLVLKYLGFLETGTFVVTKTGEAQFQLKKEPKFVEVSFKDDGALPCDPDSGDVLTHFVKVDDNKLVIHWSVASARTVVWTAFYF